MPFCALAFHTFFALESRNLTSIGDIPDASARCTKSDGISNSETETRMAILTRGKGNKTVN